MKSSHLLGARDRPLRGLSRDNFAREALAGVTLLAIAVPLNIGYAQVAGLPATAGLYALIVPSLIYALLASTRQVVASPDVAVAALVFSSLTGLGVAGEDFATMAAAQALLSGLMFLAASFFKLGFLANFLSKPILTGFIAGLALDILVSQIAKMLGLHLDADDFLGKIVSLIKGLPTVNIWAAAMSVLCLVVLMVGKRIFKAAPWALVVLVAGTLVTSLFNLEARGISVLGEVESGLPHLSFPSLEFAAWVSLIPSALALTLVTTAEGLLVSRTYAEKNGYRTKPDQDLLAFGAANVSTGLLASFAVGSSTSRTAAMDAQKSMTQLPSLVTALGALLLLLCGTELLQSIPSPAIGAVVASAIFGLLGFRELGKLWVQSRTEFGISAACILGVLLIGPLGGLLMAFVLSLVNLAHRASRPTIDILVPTQGTDAITQTKQGATQTAHGVIIFRQNAPIFFANASALSDRVTHAITSTASPVHCVGFDLEGVTDIDVTGAEAVAHLIGELNNRNIAVFLTRVRPSLLALFGHFDLLKNVNIYETNREALDAHTSY